MRELLLNEKSLDGQFESMEAFYETLPVMSRNLKILQHSDMILQKHSSLYKRKITPDFTLFDLQNKSGKVAPDQRDKVIFWKRQLSSLMRQPPFWDVENDKSGDSLQEAARRNTDVLSFLHESYKDTIIHVSCGDEDCEVRSSVSTGHLVEGMFQRGYLDVVEYIRQKYQDGRVRTRYLDTETNSIRLLEKLEMRELIEGLDRFDEAHTWKDITRDRFFDYKSYQPSAEKYNVFANSSFSDKSIDKFRCGQHSQVRCFGYREGDLFFVLRIERDHSYSDHG